MEGADMVALMVLLGSKCVAGALGAWCLAAVRGALQDRRERCILREAKRWGFRTIALVDGCQLVLRGRHHKAACRAFAECFGVRVVGIVRRNLKNKRSVLTDAA